MQRFSDFARDRVIKSAATRIPELAASQEPIFLYCQRENVNQLMAAAIHDFSAQSSKPLLIVSCARGVISVLNNHLQSDATRNLADVCNAVNSGGAEWLAGSTLYLDDLHDLPAAAQKDLIARLYNAFHGRLIVNMCRVKPKATGTRFMEPELPGIIAVVPDLRENFDNIQFFANYFLARANMEWSRNITGISSAASQLLQRFPWGGDLPELREVIYQSVFLAADGDALPEESLPLKVRQFKNDAQSLRKAIMNAERDLVYRALEQTRNNKQKAAAILRISRKTLYSKLRLFDEFAA